MSGTKYLEVTWLPWWQSPFLSHRSTLMWNHVVWDAYKRIQDTKLSERFWFKWACNMHVNGQLLEVYIKQRYLVTIILCAHTLSSSFRVKLEVAVAMETHSSLGWCYKSRRVKYLQWSTSNVQLLVECRALHADLAFIFFSTDLQLSISDRELHAHAASLQAHDLHAVGMYTQNTLMTVDIYTIMVVWVWDKTILTTIPLFWYLELAVIASSSWK